VVLPTAVAGLMLVAGSCGCGKRLKFDAAAIRGRCDVVAGLEITREQALCIARLAGLKDRKQCRLAVDDRVAGDPPVPVFRIAEPCTGLGLSIAKADGRVVEVEAHDAVAR